MKGRKVTGSSRGEKKKIRRLRNSQNVFVSDSACLDLICQIKILAVKLLFSVVYHFLRENFFHNKIRRQKLMP